MRGYSTSGTRLSPYCRRHRGCACWPRDLCGPVTGRALPGGVAPVVPQCGGWPGRGIGGRAPIVGALVVVRNADVHRAGLVKADESAVFGGCLPRWEIAGVNSYETASHVVRGEAPIVGAYGVVRNAGSSGVVSMGH